MIPFRRPSGADTPIHSRRAEFSCAALLVLAIACLLVSAVVAITAGPNPMSPSTVLSAIFRFDGSRDHLVVTLLRLPRVAAAMIAGAGLAVSGAIMQAVTRNPLASPGLLGINAGAAFAVVASLTILGASGGNGQVWYAFAGAALAALCVFFIGSVGRVGATPLAMVLAGAVVATFLTSLTTAILIFDQTTLDAVRLWTVGSLSGRTMDQVFTVMPYSLVGLFGSLVLARHLTTLSLGTDVATALGQNPALWRSLSVVVVILLSGSAVALAGPVGFVGLVVPHIVRLAISVDYRWVVPFSAVIGATMVVVADLAGRIILANQSFPVGVTMALIGAPFFLWLARYRTGADKP
ncbi:iron ABC transporter permease [Rhizobium rhizogenes]|uniref:Iron ABC transporter permease n=1 Tax=Rhizobium rhizogenes TaxID=359 RepID=A0A546X9D7_RHIRH|nr:MULTISPECIES: iron ABC transporter permease [Rhizobium/Agrobacterium group]TRA97369.1 iron ABC transporter permease [Rhizobium rhizogenes]